jgi:hypothetical protein
MKEIRVECYAGYRADEKPLRFAIRGRPFDVREVDDRWYSPGATYFRVLADDGNFYILRHDEQQDLWTLDGFRAAQQANTHTPPSEGRRHHRILVAPERRTQAVGTGFGLHLEGLVTVIGLGGMFVRAKSVTPCGAMLHLETTDPLLSFESDCVVRNVADHGVGLEFAGLTPEDEEKLKHLLELLKGAVGG